MKRLSSVKSMKDGMKKRLIGNRNARVNSLLPNVLIGLLIIFFLAVVVYGLTFFNDSSSFSSGTLSNTEINGTFIQLSTSSTAKELPDNGVDSSNLWTGVNMAGNVLLLHMDNVSYGSALSTSDSLGVGLKALWHFDGNPNDTIGLNNATTYGTITYPNTRLAQGASFDSTTSFINTSTNIGITGAQEWTISSWFNLRSSSGIRTIVNFGSGVTNYNYSQQVLYTGKAQCGGTYYTGNEWAQTDTINPNNWYNLVCTYNGTNVRAYLNGIYYSTKAYTLSIPDSVVQIGSATPANTLNGTIDDIAIWNRSLSAAEVSTLYAQQAQRVLDTSGGLNNGTFFAGVNVSSGKLDNGLSLDGRDGYILFNDSVSNTALNLTGNMSLSAWVKWDSADASSGMIMKTDTSYWNNGYGLYGHNDNKIYFFYKNYSNAASKAFTADHLWHHVVGVYNGTSNRMWVDGVEGTAFNAASIASSPSPVPLEIGRSGANTANFNGSIDEVALWNRSLSDVEVLNIYNRQKGNFINKGTYTSEVLDSRIYTNWTDISWASAGVGNLNLSIRNCTSADCSDGVWTNVGNNLTSPQVISINDTRYMQYKFDFESLDEGNSTPQVYNVSLEYIDNPPTLSFIGGTPATRDNVSSSSVVVNMTSNDESTHYSFVNLDNSLVGWWRFENSTSAIDESGSCYDNETEILTEKGWKMFSDYNNINDGNRDIRVATLNNKTGELEWQLPLQRQVYDNDKGMYKINLEDGSEILVSKEHRVYASLDTSNLSSYKVIRLPSKSSMLDFSLSNLENAVINNSGLSCDILNQTTENIFSFGYRDLSVKSQSLVINTLFSDLENSANLPFASPLGFDIMSNPCLVRNISNLLFTFSSLRNLTDWDTKLDIISSSHKTSCILQGCLNMLFNDSGIIFEDFINAHPSFKHLQDLPDHDSGAFESRLSVTNFTVCNDVFVYLNSHNIVNVKDIYKAYENGSISETEHKSR